MKKWGIYKLTNVLEEDESYCYIGSSTDLNSRKNQHFNQLKRNKHINKYLQNVYNKYGKDCLLFEIICFCEEDTSVLEELENYYINLYHSKYNLRKIAKNNTGFKHSEETKIKISNSLSGHIVSEESKEKIRIASSNMSENTKNKMRDAKIGKKFTEEHKRKMKESAHISEEGRLKISVSHKGKKLSETHIENMSNVQRNSENLGKSGYIGVVETRGGKWRAYISYKGKQINIGTFYNIDDAALAFNEKSIELYGYTRKLNEINKE